MNNEELNKIMAKADTDLEALKDRCHELYEENKRLNKENKKLKKIIFEARKMIFDNYGVLDKYEIELLDDVLKGSDKE